MQALKLTPAQESNQKQDLVAVLTLDGVDNNDVAKINQIEARDFQIELMSKCSQQKYKLTADSRRDAYCRWLAERVCGKPFPKNILNSSSAVKSDSNPVPAPR